MGATDAAVERLPERIRTPAVARAMFSPSAILLGGGGAAAAVLLGLWPLAPVAALVAWATRVGLAVPRSKGGSINPSKLPDPWRSFVLDAARAAKRFDQLVSQQPAGPLRDELKDVGGRVQAGVRECWEVATRGVALDQARQQLNLGQTSSELERLRGERSLRAQQAMDLASIDQAIAAVQRQLAAGQRVETAAFETRDKLRVLNAQLDEAVAAVVEVSLRPSGPQAAIGLRGQVDGIVDQLESLRLALDETDAINAGASAPATAQLPPPSSTSPNL